MKTARDHRLIMESAWRRSVFPRSRLNPKKSAKFEFETTHKTSATVRADGKRGDASSEDAVAVRLRALEKMGYAALRCE
jgi:hypothetical protein